MKEEPNKIVFQSKERMLAHIESHIEKINNKDKKDKKDN